MSLSEYANQPKPAPKKRLQLPHISLVVIAVVLATISFSAGMQYQKAKTPANPTAKVVSTQTGSNGPADASGFGRRGPRGNRAFGTVNAVSSSSITVQTRSGNSATYTITSSTTMSNDGQSGNVSDIQTGDTVILTLDSSNTQNVTSILLNPSFGGGPGRFGNPSSGTSDTGSTNSPAPSGA